MANKSNNKATRPIPQQPKPKAAPVYAVAPPAEPVMNPYIPAWLYDFKIQAIIVGLLAFLFYINTAKNEYALDDTIVIVKNEYVHQGFGGIQDILTKDAFDSYYRQFNSSNQLSGGRYRPLSIVSFAVEQQFFGALSKTAVDSFITYGMSFDMRTPHEKKFLQEMHIRHVVNVLLYTLSVIVLLYFLRYVVFRNNYIMALLAAILFAIHPMHTEVVANVKSRDEIMSLLFICLTFIYAFRYKETQRKSKLFASLGFYLLAFLSKEYAIAMIVLLPLSFMLFNKESMGKSISSTLPYLIVVGIYGLLRLQVVAPMNAASDADILNNPYAFASSTEKIATQIATSLNYLKLLILPYPLSADYSYNTIPYVDFGSIKVWLSILTYGFLIWLGISLFRKARSKESEVKILGIKISNTDTGNSAAVLCFAIAFFMTHFLLICNLIFNIGATMGERLIYHSSVGFCIAVAFLLYKGFEKLSPAAGGKRMLAGLTIVLVVVCAGEVWARNNDWKNDETLFNEDIRKSPNSVLVNSNVASSLINMSDIDKDEATKRKHLLKGIEHYDKALSIHPTFVQGYMNRGVAYMKLNVPDSARVNYDRVLTLYPNYPKMYEIYYNLGVCYYLNKMVPQAINIWRQVQKMNPDQNIAQLAVQNINVATQAMMAPPQQQAPAQGAPPPPAKQVR